MSGIVASYKSSDECDWRAHGEVDEGDEGRKVAKNLNEVKAILVVWDWRIEVRVVECKAG